MLIFLLFSRYPLKIYFALLGVLCGLIFTAKGAKQRKEHLDIEFPVNVFLKGF